MRKTTRLLCVAAVSLSLLWTGCGKGQQVAGIGDFTVDLSQQTLKASVELTFFKPNLSIAVPLPQMPSSFVELGPAPDGKGALLALQAPFSSIIGAVDGALPSRGLPDGRPLVGTTAATLPSFDIKIQNLSLRFYLAPDVFGVFVPLPLPSFSSPIQVPITDTRGYVVAYGVAIPPGATAGSGGLLVLFPIDSSGSNSGLISRS